MIVARAVKMGQPHFRFWPLAAVVAVVATALYLPTWRYDYTHLDDQKLILEQRSFLVEPSSLVKVFGRTYTGSATDTYYRPIVNLSFAVNAQLGAVRPCGYHLTNGLLHAAACVLLLALLWQFRFEPQTSLLGALFFAVHPVHAASVAWIPGRNDVLMTGFALGAGLLLLRDARRPSMAAKAGHLLCLLAALLSKETALCLPLLCVALLWAGAAPSQLLCRRWMWAGWACAIGLYFVARSAVVNLPSGYAADRVQSAVARLPVLLADVGKLLLPVRLQVLAAPKDTLAWPGVVVILAAAITVWRLRGLHRPTVLLGFTFVLVPMLTSLPGAKFVVLENRLYLPVAGVSVLLCEIVAALSAHPSRLRNAASVGVALVTIVFGAIALRHSSNYRDRDRFSQAAIRGSPNSSFAANLRFRRFYHRDLTPSAAPVAPGGPGR